MVFVNKLIFFFKFCELLKLNSIFAFRNNHINDDNRTIHTRLHIRV